MIFDPQLFTVSETVGSLSPGILLSRPSPMSFSLIVNVVDVNTTGNVHISYPSRSMSLKLCRNRLYTANGHHTSWYKFS